MDDAEADFHRMADIYRWVYAGKHYYIGIAESNLAEVYVEKKNYKEGERLFSRSPQYVCPNPSVRPPASGNRAGQARARDSPATPYSAAESESRAGYELLMKTDQPAGELAQQGADRSRRRIRCTEQTGAGCQVSGGGNRLVAEAGKSRKQEVSQTSKIN